MLSLLNKILLLAIFGTPVFAGLMLLLVIYVKEFRPALAFGFIGTLLFGIGGAALVGDNFGGSGMGADWAAVFASVVIGIHACAGFLFGIGIAACISPRHRLIGLALLLAGLLMPIVRPLYAKQFRIDKERHWAEKQKLQRQNPHALVNDIALPDEEDSGYRIRFVDDEGVVRASDDLIYVTPYVVLSPGKHRIVIKADTPKGERLKLTWVLQESVEVKAGGLYKLKVADGRVTLISVNQIKEPNQSLETKTMAVTPAASHPSRQP